MHENVPSMGEQPDIAQEKKLLAGVASPLDLEGKDKVFETIDSGIESSLLAWMNGRGTGGSNPDDIENLLKACPTPFELQPLEDALIKGLEKANNEETLNQCKASLDSLKKKLYGRRLELYEEFNKPVEDGYNGWNTIAEEIEAPSEAPVTTPESAKNHSIFENLESPLDDPAKFDEIIDAYAKPVGQFYNNLQYAHKGEKNASPENAADREEFRLKMFERWKKSYLDVDSATASPEQKYIKNFLESCPDVSSVYELKQIAKNSYDEQTFKQIEKVLDDNDWEHEENGWTHILSERGKTGTKPAGETKHRLYLNIAGEDIYKMANLLIDAFDEKSMPFYFKFDNDGGKRDDTFVLYCSEEDLEKTYDILKKIKEENSEMIDRTGAPVMLAGKVDGWIGYGAHPEKHPGEKKSSYSEVRAKLLEESLDQTADAWAAEHQDASYLASIREQAARNVLKGRQEVYAIWQSKGKTDAEIREGLGYGKDDLTEASLSKIELTSKDMRKAIAEAEKHNPDFIARAKQNIKTNSPKYHVDADNFCANK